MIAPLLSDQEKQDLIRILDEYLEFIHEDYDDGEEAERDYIYRVAILFYVFTGADWEAASGFHLTKGGR
jgi:hypothetical protein